jgi:AAA15 family ATPase/GTPase
MRLKSIRLKGFKRFDDLTINLGDTPKKIIALVGPNGCGKSSVFDAFEETTKNHINSNGQEVPAYFSKLAHSLFPEQRAINYNRNDSIRIQKQDGTSIFDKKSFYIRYTRKEKLLKKDSTKWIKNNNKRKVYFRQKSTQSKMSLSI